MTKQALLSFHGLLQTTLNGTPTKDQKQHTSEGCLTMDEEPGLGPGLANVTGVSVTVCPLQGIDGEFQGQALLTGDML